MLAHAPDPLCSFARRLISLLALGACSIPLRAHAETAAAAGASKGTDSASHAVAPPAQGAAEGDVHPYTIRFLAEVNGKPFDCHTTYKRVGTSHAQWQAQDLRFYVSDVRLHPAAGPERALPLLNDGVWQRSGVALLDFEDRTGTCQNGTEATNKEIRLNAPLGQHVGLHFRIAVPFQLNHADASAAEPPLDQAGLFWGWQAGYKFFALEGLVNGRHGHSVHIGSTGCQMGRPNEITSCSAPNAIDVLLPRFVLGQDAVVVDVGHLLATSNLAKTATETLNGCMAEATNPACQPIFASMGLKKGQPQSFVRTRKMTP